MAAYRRVYDSHHLQADCQEPGSAAEPYAQVIEYGVPLLVMCRCQHYKLQLFHTNYLRLSFETFYHV